MKLVFRSKPLKSSLALLLLVLLVYPLSLAVQIGIDSLFGDGAFLSALLNGSERALVTLMIDDALAALPVVIGIFAGISMLAFIARKRPSIRRGLWIIVAIFVAAPALPIVPVFLGVLVAMSSVFAALWSWRTPA